MKTYIYRDAKTGKFVTESYANANPDTTIKQEVKQDNLAEVIREQKRVIEEQNDFLNEMYEMVLKSKENLNFLRSKLNCVLDQLKDLKQQTESD